MKELKKFNSQVLLIALLCYTIIAVVFYFLFSEKFHYTLLFVPILLAAVTSFLHRKLILSSYDRPVKFINMFMAVTGIKLMIYLFSILIYIMLLTEYAIPFLAIFFSLYIVYTFIEISSLLKFLKTLDKK